METRNEAAQLVDLAVAEFKAAGVEATGEVCFVQLLRYRRPHSR